MVCLEITIEGSTSIAWAGERRDNLVGGFSNDDGDAEEHVESKINLYFTGEIRYYLDLFSETVLRLTMQLQRSISSGNTKN